MFPHHNIDKYNIQTSVAFDGNPESDLIHTTGCKQPTLRSINILGRLQKGKSTIRLTIFW
jgi:hypothetical protein